MAGGGSSLHCVRPSLCPGGVGRGLGRRVARHAPTLRSPADRSLARVARAAVGGRSLRSLREAFSLPRGRRPSSRAARRAPPSNAPARATEQARAAGGPSLSPSLAQSARSGSAFPPAALAARDPHAAARWASTPGAVWPPPSRARGGPADRSSPSGRTANWWAGVSFMRRCPGGHPATRGTGKQEARRSGMRARTTGRSPRGKATASRSETEARARIRPPAGTASKRPHAVKEEPGPPVGPANRAARTSLHARGQQGRPVLLSCGRRNRRWHAHVEAGGPGSGRLRGSRRRSRPPCFWCLRRRGRRRGTRSLATRRSTGALARRLRTWSAARRPPHGARS